MAAQRDIEEEDASNSNSLLRRHSCFRFPCLGNSSSRRSISFWERIRASQIKSEDSFFSRTFQKFREWSEIVAGPRWKTFIRRFNRNNNNRSGGANNHHHHHHRHGMYQYDPLSYALNFDEGPRGNNHFDEEGGP